MRANIIRYPIIASAVFIAVLAILSLVTRTNTGSAPPGNLPSTASAPMGQTVKGGSMYLEFLEKCNRHGAIRVKTLTLKYRFGPAHSPLIFEYNGRDYVGDTDKASLLVKVQKRGGEYLVDFEYVYEGEAQQPTGNATNKWVSVKLSVHRMLHTVYRPGEGFFLPNGTRLGALFPLFVAGDRVPLSVVWAKPGGDYKLSNVKEAAARRISVTVFDLDRKLAVEINGSRVARMASLETLRNTSAVYEYARLTRRLRELSGCRIAAIAHYDAEGPERLYVDVDYPTGLPVFLIMDGAARYRPGGEYYRNGVKMSSMPASELAVLFKLRSVEIALQLEEVAYTRG